MRYERGRCLVQEIAPLPSRLAMGAGDSEFRLGSARAAFLSPREGTLDFSQYALGFTEELRDGNIGRIAGEGREGLEAKVDTNRVDWKRNLSIDFALGDERHEPIPAGVAFERGALGRHGYGLREPQAYPSDLRAIDSLAVDLHALRDAEGVALLAFLLEFRKPGSLLEEVHERTIQVTQGLLPTPASPSRTTISSLRLV